MPNSTPDLATKLFNTIASPTITLIALGFIFLTIFIAICTCRNWSLNFRLIGDFLRFVLCRFLYDLNQRLFIPIAQRQLHRVIGYLGAAVCLFAVLNFVVEWWIHFSILLCAKQITSIPVPSFSWEDISSFIGSFVAAVFLYYTILYLEKGGTQGSPKASAAVPVQCPSATGLEVANKH